MPFDLENYENNDPELRREAEKLFQNQPDWVRRMHPDYHICWIGAMYNELERQRTEPKEESFEERVFKHARRCKTEA